MSFKKARSQRLKFGSKAKLQQKKGRGQSINHSDARVLSSHGYFKILALHAIFLQKNFGINPKKYLGESNPIERLKKQTA